MQSERDALLSLFTAETEELLAGMEQTLVGIENRPGDREGIAALFRGAHTIKGNALALELCGMPAMANAVEDLLDKVRKGRLIITSEIVSLLLRAVDALRTLLPLAVRGEKDEQLPAFSSLVEDVARQAAAGEPSERRIEEAAPGLVHPSPEKEPVARAHSLRVDIEKLDRMVTLTGEIAIHRARMRQLLEEGASRKVLSAAFGEAERLFADLQEQVMGVRMVPVGSSLRRLVRTVRDAAAAHQKLAELTIEGGDVEVDNMVVEGLRDPLLHIVRNAIDHGIEAPRARLQGGKPEAGRISIKVHREAGSIVIQVADDGSGLDEERIAARAKAMGLLEEGRQLSREELIELIFVPGFTTSEGVSDLSGRGVGMDVVRRNVESLHGSVRAESTPGCGTCIMIRLPLTVAIIDGFSIAVCGETFVVPMNLVVECLELPRDATRDDRGRGVLKLRDKALPFLYVRDVLGIEGVRPVREHVLVVCHEGKLIGLVVDQLIGEGQAVIKPLAAFRHTACIAGSTIMGTGRVALILDVPMLIRETLRRGAEAA